MTSVQAAILDKIAEIEHILISLLYPADQDGLVLPVGIKTLQGG